MTSLSGIRPKSRSVISGSQNVIRPYEGSVLLWRKVDRLVKRIDTQLKSNPLGPLMKKELIKLTTSSQYSAGSRFSDVSEHPDTDLWRYITLYNEYLNQLAYLSTSMHSIQQIVNSIWKEIYPSSKNICPVVVFDDSGEIETPRLMSAFQASKRGLDKLDFLFYPLDCKTDIQFVTNLVEELKPKASFPKEKLQLITTRMESVIKELNVRSPRTVRFIESQIILFKKKCASQIQSKKLLTLIFRTIDSVLKDVNTWYTNPKAFKEAPEDNLEDLQAILTSYLDQCTYLPSTRIDALQFLVDELWKRVDSKRHPPILVWKTGEITTGIPRLFDPYQYLKTPSLRAKVHIITVPANFSEVSKKRSAFEYVTLVYAVVEAFWKSNPKKASIREEVEKAIPMALKEDFDGWQDNLITTVLSVYLLGPMVGSAISSLGEDLNYARLGTPYAHGTHFGEINMGRLVVRYRLIEGLTQALFLNSSKSETTHKPGATHSSMKRMLDVLGQSISPDVKLLLEMPGYDSMITALRSIFDSHAKDWKWTQADDIKARLLVDPGPRHILAHTIFRSSHNAFLSHTMKKSEKKEKATEAKEERLSDFNVAELRRLESAMVKKLHAMSKASMMSTTDSKSSSS